LGGRGKETPGTCAHGIGTLKGKNWRQEAQFTAEKECTYVGTQLHQTVKTKGSAWENGRKKPEQRDEKGPPQNRLVLEGKK